MPDVKLPRTVQVGYKTVRLRVTKRKTFTHHGEYTASKHLITVRHNQPKVEMLNTVLHELFHAIWDVHEIRSKDGEERVVTLLANGLTQTLRASPEFRDWLFDQFSRQETQ